VDATDPVARAKKIRLRAMARVGASNAVGAVLVFAYFFVLPGPNELGGLDVSDDDIVSALMFALLFPVAMISGFTIGSRILHPVERWLAEGRHPDDEERSVTLSAPARLATLSFGMWVVAALFFGGLNVVFGNPARVVLRVLFGTVLGGLTTSAVCFLLVERYLRPIFALALQGETPGRSRALGIRPRLLLSWLLGSAIPLLGVLTAPMAPQVDRSNLVVPMALLAGIGLAAGGLLLVVAAKSVAEPIDSVRAGLERVEEGDLETVVPVDDGGEIGRLQAGFNRMAAGLRERERLRDLFGRHVGEEVARQALDGVARLGGEQRHVTVMFVDLVGSTALAETRTPDEVVDRLNRFFAAIVSTIDAEGGWVNKFEGDGALCVFGAPAPQPDHAVRALRAAGALQAALARLTLEAGIGVSSGVAVAGNVGARERYEYTVIGDPVNEAARLTEAAKNVPGRVLASEATVTEAGREAPHGWIEAGVFELRGRSAPTRAFAPTQSGADASALQARATPSSSTS
jgi:adenylate cyclase